MKIHSAVFGSTPREAGRAALAFVRDGLGSTRSAEVMDIDEDAVRRGVAAARLYGYLEVPDDGARLQAAKDGGVESGDRAVRDPRRRGRRRAWSPASHTSWARAAP